MNEISRLLRLHEGVRDRPYVDAAGKLTIGVGINLTDTGLYPEEIDFLLENRIKRVTQELSRKLPFFDWLSPVRAAVLVDMAYNLGVNGLLGFQRMLAAVEGGDYEKAAEEMLDSKWATQVGSRATRLAKMMRTNEWPPEVK